MAPLDTDCRLLCIGGTQRYTRSFLLICMCILCISVFLCVLMWIVVVFLCILVYRSFVFLETEKSLNFEFSNKKRQGFYEIPLSCRIGTECRRVARIPNISSLIPGDYALGILFNCHARLTVLLSGILQLLVVDCKARFEPTQTIRRIRSWSMAYSC